MLEWMNEHEDSEWMKGGFCLGFCSGFKVEGGEVEELRLRRNWDCGGICRQKNQVTEAFGIPNSRNFHTMMRGGPLRLVATAGAAVTAGIFTLSMLSSVSLGAFQTVMENKRVQKIPWVILNLAMYLPCWTIHIFSSPHHDRVTAMVDSNGGYDLFLSELNFVSQWFKSG